MRIYRLLSTISLGSLSEKGMVTLTIADDVINEKYVCLRVNWENIFLWKIQMKNRHDVVLT